MFERSGVGALRTAESASRGDGGGGLESFERLRGSGTPEGGASGKAVV